MSLRTLGKVVYFYALFIAVGALSQTIYDSSRFSNGTRSFSGLGFQDHVITRPAFWAGNFAGKYTINEQFFGFIAIFILLGIVAIIAKATEQNEKRAAGNAPPLIDANRPATLADKIWCIASHLAVFLGAGFFLPLIVYGVTQNASRFVASNAKEAMMFQVSLIIYFMGVLALSAISSVIFVPLFFGLGICYLVLSAIAAFRATKGLCYHYPLTLGFLRSMEVGRII